MTITQVPDQNEIFRVVMHYKKFYMSLGIIFVCIALFILIIIPQFQQYGQQKSETEEVQNRINILNNNLSFLSRINQENQTKELNTVLAALPDDKDYVGVLLAVKNASAKTGVGLGDFTFQVGELSQKSIITKNLPTLQLTLSLLGTPEEVGRFLHELSESLPLSNVTELKMGIDTARVVAEFYYKPVPQLQINYAQPVNMLSGQNKKNLDNLTLWQGDEANFDILAPLESSSSASPFDQ